MIPLLLDGTSGDIAFGSAMIVHMVAWSLEALMGWSILKGLLHLCRRGWARLRG